MTAPPNYRKIIKRLKKMGVPAREIAVGFSISRTSVYRILHNTDGERLKKHLAGLDPVQVSINRNIIPKEYANKAMAALQWTHTIDPNFYNWMITELLKCLSRSEAEDVWKAFREWYESL